MLTFWTALTGVATALLVVAAIYAGWLARRQVRLAVDQLRAGVDTWREENRPYLIVDFEPGLGSMYVLDFVIRNIGRTPAYDVSLSWDPAPVSAVENAAHPFRNARMLTDGVTLFAPGREHRIFFDMTHRRADRGDLPDIYTVTVNYRDRFGADHSETFMLDAAVRHGALAADVRNLHNLTVAVEKLVTQLERSNLLSPSIAVTLERDEV